MPGGRMAVTLFKALADETRIRLVHILLRHELSVNELVSILQMGQSRISRHLHILAEAGLLSLRREGLWAFYKAQKEGEGGKFLSAVAPFLEDAPFAMEDTANTNRLLAEKNAKTTQFFNEVAERWDTLTQELLGDFCLPPVVCKTMPTECNVAVDLGCGTGSVLAQMLTQAKGVIGVDGSSGMLEICRKRFADFPQAGERVSLRIGELSHLPLRDREADFASINLVLHHLEKPELALQEANRILSPQGRIFVSELLQHDDEAMRSIYGDRWLGFEEERLKGYLSESGFTNISIEQQKIGRGLTLLLISATKK